MKVYFDVPNLYYLPQFLPIYHELRARGDSVVFVCYTNKAEESNSAKLLNESSLPHKFVIDDESAATLYVEDKPDWILFGKGFAHLDQVHTHSKTAQLGHGVGPKPSYYRKSDTPMTVRFIEGALRLEKIQKMYPNDTFVQVGYSKLDPMFDGTQEGFDLVKFGLDPSKKTILYAPTFNPSSLECFPDNWPQDFNNYNILIKAHGFTYARARYQSQRDKLNKWASFSNVYVADGNDLSLLPFMKAADILLSEASSTLFEFVALKKPVIVCNFFKLKWSYRGPFKYRFEQRFGKDNVLYKDIGRHIQAYNELDAAIQAEFASPHEYEANRAKYTEGHIGPTDGLSSKRIVDYLSAHCTGAAI